MTCRHLAHVAALVAAVMLAGTACSRDRPSRAERAVERVGAVPESDLAPFQACARDEDCTWTTNGCCDCANGGNEIGIARRQEASPALEVVRASGAARAHGIETRVIDGVKVRITTPAKTVADCFRFRRHVGLEVALAALKDYLKKRKGSIDTLVAAARADRIYALMRPYLEALA
jgi:hypothetical protein